MHEMLGNQYFLSRKYSQAARNFRLALKNNPHSKAIRRRLVICYSQIGKVEEALFCFRELIEEHLEYVLNTDPEADDCPCRELVMEMEKKFEYNKHSLDYILILGMYYLYCDLNKSIYYFTLARDLSPSNSDINSILKTLVNYRQIRYIKQ